MYKRLDSFYRGDTKTYKFIATDSNGNPYNIIGWTIWFTMKINEYDSDAYAVIQKSITIPANDVNGAVGIAYLTLDSDETDLLEPNTTYYYDFQKVEVGTPPIVSTIMKGTVSILHDITRSTA